MRCVLRLFRKAFGPWVMPAPPKREHRRTRLRLEPLEDRITPTTYTVTSANDSGAGTLRYYLDQAQTGDTINFSTVLNNRTITLNSPLYLGANAVTDLTIDAGTVNVTLAGNGSTSLFEVVEGSDDTIDNLTLSGGRDTSGLGGGAGYIMPGAELTLDGDTFLNNQSTASGGAIVNGGSLDVIDCLFTENAAPNGSGGAIWNQGDLFVELSEFTGNGVGPNASSNGGAIESNGGGSLQVDDTDFFNNQAPRGSGGAIDTSDETSLDNDMFGGSDPGQTGNTAYVGGGAINALGTNGVTKLTVTNSSFTGNKVTSLLGQGGAINTTDILDVEFSDFVNNSAPASGATYGGAINYQITNTTGTAFDSVLELKYDTFTNNSALDGGAVYAKVNVNAGTITEWITGSTFASNTASGNYGGMLASNATSGTGSVAAHFINDTFFQNQASEVGGLCIATNNSGTGTNTAEMTSLTVYKNQASSWVAGVYVSGPTNTVTADNCIFDGNIVTDPNFTGPVDIKLSVGTAFQMEKYNLVGSSDKGFDPINNNDISDANNDPKLANALAQNGAPADYPQTLALQNTSPGYEKGDPGLAGQPDPNGLDERGFTRQSGKVSIGAEDPDAT